MKQLKIANNIAEILVNGKVVNRMSNVTEEDQERVQQLVDSEEYEVITFNQVVEMDTSVDRDWTESLIEAE